MRVLVIRNKFDLQLVFTFSSWLSKLLIYCNCKLMTPMNSFRFSRADDAVTKAGTKELAVTNSKSTTGTRPIIILTVSVVIVLCLSVGTATVTGIQVSSLKELETEFKALNGKLDNLNLQITSRQFEVSNLKGNV